MTRTCRSPVPSHVPVYIHAVRLLKRSSGWGRPRQQVVCGALPKIPVHATSPAAIIWIPVKRYTAPSGWEHPIPTTNHPLLPRHRRLAFLALAGALGIGASAWATHGLDDEVLVA